MESQDYDIHPTHSAHLQHTNTDDDAGSDYDDKARILVWIDAAITAGPPKKVGDDVIEPDGEAFRAPFKRGWRD